MHFHGNRVRRKPQFQKLQLRLQDLGKVPRWWLRCKRSPTNRPGFKGTNVFEVPDTRHTFIATKESFRGEMLLFVSLPVQLNGQKARSCSRASAPGLAGSVCARSGRRHLPPEGCFQGEPRGTAGRFPQVAGAQGASAPVCSRGSALPRAAPS